MAKRPPKHLISVRTAAARLKCTPQNIRYLLAHGQLEGWQVNTRCWVVTAASVKRRANRGR